MKKVKLFLAVSCLALLAASCGNGLKNEQERMAEQRAKSASEIKNLETEMRKSLQISDTTAEKVIKAYSDFAATFPDDSITPDYLFKAGQVATATQQYQNALNFYQSITAKYPKFKFIQESLYLQGYLLDNFLNNEVKAKAIYDQVIALYPSTVYATDAQAAIDNFGKTDQQIMDDIKKKNGEK